MVYIKELVTWEFANFPMMMYIAPCWNRISSVLWKCIVGQKMAYTWKDIMSFQTLDQDIKKNAKKYSGRLAIYVKTTYVKESKKYCP